MDFSKVKKWEIGGKEVKILTINGQTYWKKAEPIVECKAFYIEDASGEQNTLNITKNGSIPDIQLEYSTDGSIWEKWVDVYNTPLSLSPNSKMYLRGTNDKLADGYSERNIFDCSKNFNVGGDITTLLTPEGNVLDLTIKNIKISFLFYNNTKLINAKELILPSTTLTSQCYHGMFYGCSSMVTSPKVLPAMVLSEYAYNAMFFGCTSLVATPELLATTLGNYCYTGLFQNCSKVNSIKVSATSWDVINSGNWVIGVASSGTFTKPKGVDIPTGNSGIPSGWTIVEV